MARSDIARLYIAWLIAAVMLAFAAVGRHPYSKRRQLFIGVHNETLSIATP